MIGVSVFILLLPIALIAFYARFTESTKNDYKSWHLALSAAATGNSGFIMTGAIGAGYAAGLKWVLLPLAWFLGDLLFWYLKGPGRIVKEGKRSNSLNMSGVLGCRDGSTLKKINYWLVTLIALFLLGAYITSQWSASEKVLSEAFSINDWQALLLAALFVGGYSILGGFKGSVWTDIYQAVLILIVTVVSLVMVVSLVNDDTMSVANLPNGFFSLSGTMGISTTICFVVGYAFAAIGFGFGQPQVNSRYLAAVSSDDIQRSKWVYLGFLQFTWIGMTVFGVLLRTAGFQIDDGERGLIAFFNSNGSEVLVGLALAGILCTIASTIDSIIISLKAMVFPERKLLSNIFAIGLVAITVYLSAVSSGTVFQIALFAVSIVGGSLGGVFLARCFGIKSSDIGTLLALICSFLVALYWNLSGIGERLELNEAVPGIIVAVMISLMFRTKKS